MGYIKCGSIRFKTRITGRLFVNLLTNIRLSWRAYNFLTYFSH